MNLIPMLEKGVEPAVPIYQLTDAALAGMAHPSAWVRTSKERIVMGMIRDITVTRGLLTEAQVAQFNGLIVQATGNYALLTRRSNEQIALHQAIINSGYV